MEAAVWTLIALLGTALAVLIGAFFRLGGKIGAQGRDLREAIDARRRDLATWIDAQSTRIDALNARMDAHLERYAS
jgi:hypothetical protein